MDQNPRSLADDGLAYRLRAACGRSVMRRVRAEGCLRVGYVAARPWSHTELGRMTGCDVQACRRLAAALSVAVSFSECVMEDVASWLLAGRYDVAVGGLVRTNTAGVDCVPARHMFGDANRQHRSHYPNVWWVRDDDLLWSLRVRSFFAMQRIRERTTRFAAPLRGRSL